jgi:HAMP domain-containing protein
MSESDRADHVGLMSISLTSMWNAARNAGGDPPNIGDNALFETTRTVHDAQARYTKLRSDIAKRPRLIAKIPKDSIAERLEDAANSFNRFREELRAKEARLAKFIDLGGDEMATFATRLRSKDVRSRPGSQHNAGLHG